MGFSTDGADKALKGITGAAVTGAATVTMTAHTAAAPSNSDELSGNGYSAHTFTGTDFDGLTTVAGYRRLTLPEVEFFADAGASAQTIEGVAVQHGTIIAYSQAEQLVPNNARVYLDPPKVEIQLAGSGVTFTPAALDRALQAGIGGQAMTAQSMYWALHSGSTAPSTTNLVTGGGLVPVQDAAWSYSTASDYRRASQAAITFTTGLTADTDAEPTRLALWNGDPSGAGTKTLYAWRAITPANMTASGSSIAVSANSLYIEVNIDGAAA